MMRNLKSIALMACMLLFFAACDDDDDTTETEDVMATKQYVEGDYTLVFENTDPEMSTATRDSMVSTFFIVYPKMAARFNQNAVKTVVFVMDIKYDKFAYTVGNVVTYGAVYMREYPEDTDIVTHESMHIVQSYVDAPGWLTEGIADYARYVYGVHNTGWSLQPILVDQYYTDGYGVTGSFLLWVEQYYREDIVDQLNAALFNRTYTDDLWVELTGHTVEDLWNEYYY